jgi:hypothetical protein
MTKLAGLIEPEILAQIDEQSSEVNISSQHLLALTHNRFDLAFKLYFLQGLDLAQRSEYRERCYKQHIQAFSEGTFSEPNNPEKNSYQQFKHVFQALFNSIKIDGFDAEKSLIPLAKDGSILNGAHRTAATVFFNQPAGVIQTQLPPRDFDYRYFQTRGVPVTMLDTAAQTYIEYDPKCFLAAVWPAAQGHDQEIEQILSQVVYKKQVSLTYNGAHNLLAEAYKNEPWLGARDKNFPGIKNKLVGCFPSFEPVRVYLFRAESLEQVLTLKDQVRALFGLAKHAIHITDDQEETLRLGRLLFNDNGVHFLNYAYPRKFSNDRLTDVDQRLSDHKLTKDSILLDEAMVLDVYGLRASDGTPELKAYFDPESKIGDYVPTFFQETQSELFDNPKNYFYYRGFKFMSLEQVLLMKKKRRQNNDSQDIRLIKSFTKNSAVKRKWDTFRSALYFKKITFIANTKQGVAKILIKLGLFDLVKKLFR